MQRNIDKLAERRFDVVIVGGGVQGAWAALDAAQRGLSVALVEQGDFCSATSANSHRIIHGGLRYLQHGDLRRMRESVRERTILLRNAPGFVRPLPVLVPTARNWSRRRLLMRCALTANDLISADRNHGVDAHARIPAGRLLSIAESQALAPSLDLSQATGGALFHDAQILSAERFVLTILERACEAGATVANYIRATDYIREGARIVGIRARDVLGGPRAHGFEIRARVVLNCVGPWSAEQMLTLGPGRAPDLDVFKAAVLVVRDLGLKSAVAIPSRRAYTDSSEVLRKNYRNFFITPWRGLSLIGTFYAPHAGSASVCRVSESEITSWLTEINEAWPSLGLTRDDIFRVLAGLLPRGEGSTPAQPQYAKRFRIIDHDHTHSAPGLISVVGVKFTTARGVAERAVNAAAATAGLRCAPCRTDRTVLECDPSLSLDVARSTAELRADRPALRRSMQRAAREEMACTLADAILRRTDLAATGLPDRDCLLDCAAMIGNELGWGLMRREREVGALLGMFGEGGIVHAA